MTSPDCFVHVSGPAQETEKSMQENPTSHGLQHWVAPSGSVRRGVNSTVFMVTAEKLLLC